MATGIVSIGEARFGQAKGHDAAGRAGADDQDVCGFGGHRWLLPIDVDSTLRSI